ncbi:conserved protein of unknown function [Tenacibaculum sp. 190130A14a]|uniref:N-acetyltransferase domain-containing protein n=1 Tax=Tenacibaculum polynesiense TaxID=3137857 RepID=A0ABM9PEZ2_9FLAO
MESFVFKGRNFEVNFDNKAQKCSGIDKSDNKGFKLVFFSFPYSSILKITHFQVDEEKRKKGLGRFVLSKFEEWAKNENFKQIIGDITKNKDYSNPKDVVKFYKKSEYEISLKDKGMIFAEISKNLV